MTGEFHFAEGLPLRLHRWVAPCLRCRSRWCWRPGSSCHSSRCWLSVPSSRTPSMRRRSSGCWPGTTPRGERGGSRCSYARTLTLGVGRQSGAIVDLDRGRCAQPEHAGERVADRTAAARDLLLDALAGHGLDHRRALARHLHGAAPSAQHRLTAQGDGLDPAAARRPQSLDGARHGLRCDLHHASRGTAAFASRSSRPCGGQP